MNHCQRRGEPTWLRADGSARMPPPPQGGSSNAVRGWFDAHCGACVAEQELVGSFIPKLARAHCSPLTFPVSIKNPSKAPTTSQSRRPGAIRCASSVSQHHHHPARKAAYIPLLATRRFVPPWRHFLCRGAPGSWCSASACFSSPGKLPHLVLAIFRPSLRCVCTAQEWLHSGLACPQVSKAEFKAEQKWLANHDAIIQVEGHNWRHGGTLMK